MRLEQQRYHAYETSYEQNEAMTLEVSNFKGFNGNHWRFISHV